MSQDSFKVKKSLNIEPKTGSTITAKGDVAYNATSNQLEVHNGTTAESVTTATNTQTVQNKALDNTNTVTVKDANLTVQDDVDPTKQFKFQASAISTGTTRTITIPDADFTISSPTSTETLFNKSLDDTTTAIVDTGDATKKIKFDAGGTTATNTTITAAQTANRVVTLPDATDTLVGKNTTDILTNKSMSGASNTFTAIPNSATTATAANTPSTIVARDGSGNFVAGTITASLTGNATNVTGTVAIANGGTGQTAKTAAYDALSPNTTKGDIEAHNGTNNVRLAAGTFGQVLSVDSSAATGLKYISIPQGLKNYVVTNPSVEQGNTTGFGLGTVTLTSNFPSGVPSFGSGASGNLTLSAVSSGQLAGTYSLSYASSAATTAGNFVATDAFAVDLEGQAKVMAFNFFYSAAVNAANGNFSGTSSNSYGVAIYDVTNSAWIQPAGVFNIIQSSGVGKCSGTFQTSSNGTSYRLVMYNANASAGAITMYLDDFFVGPQITAAGAAASDWAPYTVSITSSGTPPAKGGTIAIDQGYWRRVGDSVEIHYEYRQNSAGTTGTGFYLFSLPTGLVADTTKMSAQSASAERSGCGFGYGFDGTNNYALSISLADTTHFSMQDGTTGGVAVGASRLPLGNSLIGMTANVKIPIVGWSSNTVMSNDTDTRVVAAKYGASTTTVGTGDTIVNFTVADYDTHAAVTTGASWKFVAPVSGKYKVTSSIVFPSQTLTAAAVARITLYKNGVAGSILCNTYTAAYTGRIASQGSTEVDLIAGDFIDLRAAQPTSGALDLLSPHIWASIERLSGPATIAATESVTMRAVGQPGSTTAGNITIFPTKSFDSHGAYNTSTGQFTAPISGTYSIACYMSATNAFAFSVYVAGSIDVGMGATSPSGGNAGQGGGATVVKVLAGQTIDVRPNATTGTFTSGNNASNLCITRIGN